jgi:hypothetical protein
MAERLLHGLTRDTFGRIVVSGALSAAALAAGEKMSGGFVRDQNKRLIMVGPEGGGFPIGNGENVTVYTANPEPRLMNVKDGTVASPVTEAHPTLKVSRTEAVTGGVTGDGSTELGAIYGSVSGTAGSKVQGIGVMGSAQNVGTEGTPDACGIYGVGRILAGGKGRAFGGFLLGRRDAAEQRATGLECAVENLGGADSYDINTGAEETKGIWLHGGTAKSACGIQVGTISEAVPSFDVALGINKFAVATAVLQDNSKAERSIQIKGEHAKAAVSVGVGAGPVVVGAEEVSTAAVMLEVYSGEEALDPMVKFGTNKGKSVSMQPIGNSTGSAKIFASNASNAFLTGTAQGDTGINFTAGKIFHIGAQTKTSLLRVSETGVGFNGAAPVAKASAITSPAAELASLKTAVDAIRVALTNVGITA